MEIDEIITVEEHNPEWKVLYEQEKQKIAEALGRIIVNIEHIGSTSVSGLKAKPIIDVMIGTAALNLQDETIRVIKNLGYDYFGEISPGRIYCRKRQEVYYNLTIVIYDEQLWKNNVLFRDYLRSHPADAAKYSELKEKAISNGLNTLLEYSAWKVEFITELMEKAKIILSGSSMQR